MNLIPFPNEALRVGATLSFDLHDAGGRLLLSAGTRLDSAAALERLRGTELFVDETKTEDWRRRQVEAMDTKLLQNAAIKDIVAARPTAAARAPVREFDGITQLDDCTLALERVLRDIGPDPDWVPRLQALHDAMLRLYRRRPDAALYWLLYQCAHSTAHYSSQHALLCALVARETALQLGWADERLVDITVAALTMNVSMQRLQDRLASAPALITAPMRAEIASHPERSATMLAGAGASERIVAIVRLHHENDGRPLDALDACGQAARLLHRADVFTAKLSRRHDRAPMSPLQAARDSFLGPGGVPDTIGAALLKAVGMYPPGSFVELQSGERGIVIARGRQANLPLVAALVSASGMPLAVPVLRQSSDRRHAVKSALAANAVKVIPPHEKLMALA